MSKKLDDESTIQNIHDEIEKATPSYRKWAFEKFIMAALGSIPWVGGIISASAGLIIDKDDVERDKLQTQWLEEHTIKLRRLELTLRYIADRFNNLGEEIDNRIQSEEYLDLVRKAVRVWDHADTDEKRKYVADLIANASAISLTSDDIVRLFIDWLDTYHEAHFAVIREIYQRPGSTRDEIWKTIHGEFPREDSAEADLYRMLIRDLSIGGVIRQDRATTSDGRFLKRQQLKSHIHTSQTMESAFEETKPYVLTALGEQFVHYTMTELVSRIGSNNGK
jgi:hypothetical protein